MKLALIPVNVRIGDFEENLKVHYARVNEAVKQGASFLVFPELSLVGYLPRDLLQRPSWARKAEEQLNSFHAWLREHHPKLPVVVGTTVSVESTSPNPRNLANCAVFLQGERREVRAKTLVPYYDVFHESRYFDSAETLDESFRAPIEFDGRKLGLLICEDSWHNQLVNGKKAYQGNPTKRLVDQGCDFLVNISASPYHFNKSPARRATIQAAVKEHCVMMAYANHFGAHDDIIFDGDCFVFGCEGELLAAKEEASSDILYWKEGSAPKARKVEGQEYRDLRLMLVTGIRDYARKNGFSKAVLGISGGIDSAIVAALACEALGPENVIGLAMPTKFSSSHSVEDAEALARNLGLVYRHFPIKMPHATFAMALQPFFSGMPEDVTEENVQARLRGVAVMAFANKFRALALATGNKSEFAMGYSTLYGDMAGALSPIGDLYKTEVYALTRFMNRERELIPERTITKAPSAELRPGQVDQDSLPPYEILDAMLYLLVERELDVADALPILREKFPEVTSALFEKIQRSLRINEYKRKQAAPILRVSPRAFGTGRLYPLTCVY